MTIAIDAMGGDYAPAAIVEGAVRAKRELGLDIILVGQKSAIKAELKRLDAKGEIPIRHAASVVAMGEAPTKAIREKQDTSIAKACQMVKDGEAQAVVSAGNSGATMAGAVLGWGRVPGIERPALSLVLPSLGGPTVIIDVGANVDSQPRHLVQFGIMAGVFAEHVLEYTNPGVGLLSVGEEDAKGNDQTRRAHELFRRSHLNFAGNVEGRDIFAGHVPIIVCDGFVGNICLKLTEGVVKAMGEVLKKEINADLWSQIGGLLLKDTFKRVNKKYDYAEYGGAPLLGVNGACLICHGASGSRAIKNAARLARDWITIGFNDKLVSALAKYREVAGASAVNGKPS